MVEENLNMELKKENIKQIMEELFSEKEAFFIKVIENQALYRLGRVEQENIFLKEKIELLQKEIERLKNISPDDNNISIKLAQKEEFITRLEKENIKISEANMRLEEEKKKLEEQLKLLPAEPEKINATLLQNAEHLFLLKFQNEEIVKKYEEMEDLFKSMEEENKTEKEKSKARELEIEELKIKLHEEQDLNKKYEEETRSLKEELEKFHDNENIKDDAKKKWGKFW